MTTDDGLRLVPVFGGKRLDQEVVMLMILPVGIRGEDDRHVQVPVIDLRLAVQVRQSGIVGGIGDDLWKRSLSLFKSRREIPGFSISSARNLSSWRSASDRRTAVRRVA